MPKNAQIHALSSKLLTIQKRKTRTGLLHQKSKVMKKVDLFCAARGLTIAVCISLLASLLAQTRSALHNKISFFLQYWHSIFLLDNNLFPLDNNISYLTFPFVEKLLNLIQKMHIYKLILFVCISIGNKIMSFTTTLGEFSIFSWKLLTSALHRRFFFNNFLNSLYLNGFCSIPVVGLTGFFTGAVLTVQLFNSLSMFRFSFELVF